MQFVCKVLFDYDFRSPLCYVHVGTLITPLNCDVLGYLRTGYISHPQLENRAAVFEQLEAFGNLKVCKGQLNGIGEFAVPRINLFAPGQQI